MPAAGWPLIACINGRHITPWCLSVRRIGWLIPMMQTLHILANGLVLSAIIMINLRVWRRAGAEQLADRVRRLLTWLWSALGVLTVTGLVLVLGKLRRSMME